MTTTKRPPGRPRNANLDKLEEELALTRRRCSSLLKEQGKADADTGTLAGARLKKIGLEIERLEIEVHNAILDQQVREGQLIPLEEVKEVLCRPYRISKQLLDVMPKSLAPRLFNQPQKEIERTLAAWVDALADNLRSKI
jgi:hypothetical protein